MDLFSSNYGWTTEYILKLSLHEIYWRLNHIYKRLNSNRKFEASIHGIELQEPATEEKKSQKAILSNDQEKALDIALKRARERKRLEFQRGS